MRSLPSIEDLVAGVASEHSPNITVRRQHGSSRPGPAAKTEVPLTAHPNLVASADPQLRTPTATDGTLTVPARSVAVFVAPAQS